MYSESNNERPIVSILLPAYNVAQFLSQCLDSIVNQSYQCLQVIVVDDGSQDNTLEIAKSFAEKYPFVEVHHQENKGVASARNKLISLAKGDYVLFVDSDDWIEKDMIECLLKTLDETQADIAVCGFIKESGGVATTCPIVNKEFLLEGAENVMKALLFHKELNGSLWNKMVPREFYEGLTFRKDIWYGEDCLFFWQALNRGVDKICFMNECFYHYRMNNQSISHEKFNFKKMSGHEVWKQINTDVQKKWPSLSDLGKAAYAVSDMWLLYYAALDYYAVDETIMMYQKNVKHNLRLIYKSGLIAKKKFLFAILVSVNYSLASKVIRKIG